MLLINDKDSGVGALFADTRTHGVVKGSGDPEPRMDYVVNDEKVTPGETILTSGEDRIFPKGLLIGTVADAASAMPFQVIHVKPAARLDRLEDVIVLLSQQELAPKKSTKFPTSPSSLRPLRLHRRMQPQTRPRRAASVPKSTGRRTKSGRQSSSAQIR